MGDTTNRRKKVSATFCLETPAFGRGRVACGDRQKVADTFFLLFPCLSP